MSNVWHDQPLPEYLQVGEEVLPLVIKRHHRARRICLRYNPTEHAISLTLPRHTRVSEGLQFLTDKSAWLIETLNDMPTHKRIKPGVVIPLLGERIRVRHDPTMRRSFTLIGDTLTVSGARDFFPRRMTEALKKIAAHRLSELAIDYSKKAGRPVRRLSVRDTKSRWGSCSSTGNLSFSWRLVFAPR